MLIFEIEFSVYMQTTRHHTEKISRSALQQARLTMLLYRFYHSPSLSFTMINNNNVDLDPIQSLDLILDLIPHLDKYQFFLILHVSDICPLLEVLRSPPGPSTP